MSDLESVRHARDAIITEAAGGKLRSLARGGVDQPANEGLLDAFAEVFARMSESQSVAPIDEQVETHESEINPPSDSNLGTESESEAESQSDDSHQYCLAVNQDEISGEDVELPTSPVAETIVSNDRMLQQTDDVELPVEADAGVDVAAPVVTKEVDPEAESPELADEQVRQVMPHEDGEDEDVVQRRRKAGRAPDSTSTEARPQQSKPLDEDAVAENSESEIASADFDEKLDQPVEETGGQSRRSRRARHHGGRHHEKSQESVSQSGFRESVSKVDSLMNSEMQAAGSTAERLTRVTHNQDRTAAAALHRSVQAATAASAVPVTNAPNAGRFGATAGNGIRDVAQNPAAGATNRVASRNVAESRGKSIDAPDTLSRVKLIQRVSKAFQHLGPEGGVIRLRLAPAEMGSVRVEMRIQQRKVAARVVAETEAASAALREHLPDLRARLESFGMQVEQLDIETENLDHDRGSSFEDATSRDESWQEPDRRQQREKAKPFQQKNVVDVSQSVSPVVTASHLSAGMDVHL